ncbi:hypothetical protein IWX65_002887 [Arthrobacter sp. CAN_A214]|uniref:hypothetical protein n=1 Tax=Arthrobacter sp. CAN_A214 TaxID=2787720 RepID=UPI0018CB5FAA
MLRKSENRDDGSAGESDDVPLSSHNPHWHELKKGDPVIVEFVRGSWISGHIDAITDDRNVLWVQLKGQGRRLIHQQDSISLIPGSCLKPNGKSRNRS